MEDLWEGPHVRLITYGRIIFPSFGETFYLGRFPILLDTLVIADGDIAVF